METNGPDFNDVPKWLSDALDDHDGEPESTEEEQMTWTVIPSGTLGFV